MKKKQIFPVSITEPTLNVILSKILSKRGLQALGEVILHSTGKKPDILITLNGIKIIIEGKFSGSGISAILENKCKERIDEGLCEICVAIQYSKPVFHTLSPTIKEIEENFSKTKFQAYVAWVGFTQLRNTGWNEVNINQLVDMVNNSFTSLVSEDILGEAIKSLSKALQDAAEKLTASKEYESLSENINKVMEIPTAPAHGEDEE